jgi:hypothetical protein
LTLSISHDGVEHVELVGRVALRTRIRFMGMRRFDRAKGKTGIFIRNRKGGRRADRNAGITVASAP